jgi:hypothetical protein
MTSVFLAHASEDKNLVRELYSKLNNAGFNAWLDEYNLMPGQNWQIEIDKMIKESDIFLACLSKNAVKKQGYIQKELRLALNVFAERPPNSFYIIPLKLDDCEVPNLQIPQIGVDLRAFHWLNYWEPEGFDRLVTAIRAQSFFMDTIIDKETAIEIIKEVKAQSQVHQAHLLRGGRELVVYVKPEILDDLESVRLAIKIKNHIKTLKDITTSIKVTVIRETRAIDYT